MSAQNKIATQTAAVDPRPASAVSSMVGIAGLLGLGAWVIVARMFEFSGPNAALCAFVACGAPMVAWSLFVDKVHRNPTTGIDWDAPPRPFGETRDTSFIKLVGLWSVWAAIAMFYCLGRWYWEGDYLFAMKILGYGAVPLLVLSIPYVLWIDRRLKSPRDGAWHMGQFVIGRTREVDREQVHDFLRSWTIKAFFLAFMIAGVPGNWQNTITPSGESILLNIANLALWLVGAMFMIDTVFATIGYMLTMKPLDSHIRSANPYAAGWVAALICYPPFVLMNVGGPLHYQAGTADWLYWLSDHPVLITLWAIALVVLTMIYAWATVVFGIRFSNLTHRGILTHGPYAWTKHPAYLSKNLFWWLATLPFLAVTGDMNDAIRNSALLGIVSGVYYWRARTEERHLMADPAYREYAEWMERHGPIPRLLRKLSGGSTPAAIPAE
ncbi:MAG TPA: protein-S-isoprenylcysteine methyltransferase [Allosphingosinicella sp.]|nr:protein-S-isoprenylcysteine methyltransferase [Allosphingosinicella sp.]